MHEFLKHQRLYYKTIIYSFQNLAGDDPLLQMMVDVHVWDSPNGEVDEDEEVRRHLPVEFLLKVKDGLASVVHDYEGGFVPSTLEECDYHGHTLQDEKEACEMANGKTRCEDCGSVR